MPVKSKSNSNSIFRKSKKIFFEIISSLILLSVIWVVFYRYINPPFTPLMIMRYINKPAPHKSVKKKWADLDSISENLVLAAIASEDQRFLQHNGFDIHEINKSILEFEQRGMLRGASTISQQTAKNVFLFPARSWIRKGFESYFTILIEIFWSKKRIIEIYLNVVELGDGLYGAEAASNFYFKKSAKKLTESESAFLATLLPNPLIYSKNYTNSLRVRQQWIMKQMKNLGGNSYLKGLKD